ncbi:MAG: RtcB family protein, partial [Bacteroidota bacterium]
GNKDNIPVNIFANEQVRIERQAVDELNGFLQLQETIHRIQEADPDFFADSNPGITQVGVTPDFHKGSGIPIGTVTRTRGFLTPQAIGKDVNCGMRLMVTDWPEAEVRRLQPELEKRIRHVYFEGGRGIFMDRIQKEAMLREGLYGLLETAARRGDRGIWKYYRPEEQLRDLDHVIDSGSMPTEGIFRGLHNYIDHKHVSADAQIGSIGGGNHFVEVQRVKEVLDASTAYAWGLKKGAIVVMIHTGSVSVGYPASGYMPTSNWTWRLLSSRKRLNSWKTV